MNKLFKVICATVVLAYITMIVWALKMDKHYGVVETVCVLGGTGKYECFVVFENGEHTNATTNIEFEPNDMVYVGENYFGSYVLR